MHNRFKHDDGTCTSSLASGGSSATRQWMAVGAESGAVSLFNNFSGETEESDTAFNFCHFQKQRTVLNLTTKVTSMAFHPSAEIVAIASDQVRMISLSLSLSLSISDSVSVFPSFYLRLSLSCFQHCYQIPPSKSPSYFPSLANMSVPLASQAKDQLKLVHLPSCTVFSNWPTERTPLGKSCPVCALEFCRISYSYI